MNSSVPCNLSLLSRKWITPVLSASIIYAALQFAMLYDHITSIRPNCDAPAFSEWTWYLNFFEACSFCMVVIIQLSQYATNSTSNDYGSIFSTCCISLLAGTSSLINISGNPAGICEDIFGVRLPGVLWPEWITCVPLLIYVVLATDTKIKLCRNDIVIIWLFVAVFMSAIGLQFCKSYPFAVCLLIIAIVFFFIGYTLFFLEIFPFNHNQITSQNRMTVSEEISKSLKQTRSRLAVCLLTMLPLFPMVYLLSVCRLINHDTCYLFIVILNVTAKLLFTTIIANTHIHATAEVRRFVTSTESVKVASEVASQESRRLFIRYIMHEVRVPLNSITMGLGYLEQCPSLDDEAQEALLMMNGATGFMKSTFDDILKMQKIEDGILSVQLSSFSITDMTYRVRASLQQTLLDKQISFLISIHKSIPVIVIGDVIQVEHILATLLNNALKFSNKLSTVTMEVYSNIPMTSNNSTNNSSNVWSLEAKKKKLFNHLFLQTNSISFSTTENNSNIIPNIPIENSLPFTLPKKIFITFVITDNGCGISESELNTLFLPYSQIHPHDLHHSNSNNIESNGSGTGTGIGLMICKQMVERLGGTLTCQSTIGIGTTFTFSLPFDTTIRTTTTCNDNDNDDKKEEILQLPDSNCSQSYPSCQGTKNSNNSNSNNNNIIQHIGLKSSKPTPRRDTSHSKSILQTFDLLSASDFIFENDEALVDDDEDITTSRTQPMSGIRRSTIHNSIGPFYDNSTILRQASYNIHSYNDHDNNNNNNNDNIDNFNLIENGDNNRYYTHQSSMESHLRNDNNEVLSFSSRAHSLDQDSHHHLKNILIIDDVTSNRRILSMLLRKKCLECSMAANGLEGVEMVLNGRLSFDLIFMDNSMPIMTGIEATKRLRAAGFANLIIGLTGNAMEQDVQEFIAAGVDSVILKPITALQINQIIDYCQKFGTHHIPSRNIVYLDDRSYIVEG